MTAGATTPNTTYYACLKAGKLTKVGTTSPTCPKGASVISWESQASPQTEYTWTPTVAAQTSGGDFSVSASTNLPADAIVHVVSASMTGNFSQCPEGADTFFQANNGSGIAARWTSLSGSVTNASPSSTTDVTLSSVTPMNVGIACGGSSGTPAVTFDIVFTVPSILYS